jgi:tripartite-type tricarboxylate transporter receptor subunit TctC
MSNSGAFHGRHHDAGTARAFRRQVSAAVGAVVLVLSIISAAASEASAQTFPTRPVRIIVPYAPGGSGDILTRLLGAKLSAIWGQQVVIENKPGGGGLIATEIAARATPDGHTIYLATDGPVTVAPFIYKSVPYDWKRDLAPISMMAVGYQILIVSPKLPVKTLKEFIAYAKERPGKLNYASIGVGSPPHLAAEIFKSNAKVDITHVPYRGATAQAIASLIAGEVQMFMVGTTPVIGPVKAGKLRGLAVTSPTRVDGLPDVPTFAEEGLANVDVKLWFALMAPGGTPKPIIGRLHAAIAKAVADPDYKATLDKRGFQAKSMTPEEFADFLDKDHARLGRVVKAIGLTPQ